MSRRGQLGFTLIEVLIALFIFAILSAITVVGLRSVIKSYKSVSTRQQQLQRLDLAVTLIRRDISQIVYRPSVDSKGHAISSVRSIPDGLTFTRTGGVNPNDMFRQSDLLQVTYSLQSGELVRITSSADLNSYGQLVQLVLLENVKSLNIEYVEDKGALIEQWPLPISNQNVTPESLPRAIKVSIELQTGLSLVVLVPLASGSQYGKV